MQILDCWLMVVIPFCWFFPLPQVSSILYSNSNPSSSLTKNRALNLTKNRAPKQSTKPHQKQSTITRFEYTANLKTSLGTRLSKISYNSTVELVLQDTNLLSVESHPFHLHGNNFFVVGTGVGNFDSKNDPKKYSFYLFFFAFLGVWFMHCHLELHTGWGLKMAFVVENGKGKDQSICHHLKIFHLVSCLDSSHLLQLGRRSAETWKKKKEEDGHFRH